MERISDRELQRLIDTVLPAVKMSFNPNFERCMNSLIQELQERRAADDKPLDKTTNGNRIRLMNNVDLAKEFIHHDCKCHCKNYNPDRYSGANCLTAESCLKGIVRWLEDEVEKK